MLIDTSKLTRIKSEELKAGDIVIISFNESQKAYYRICKDKDEYILLSILGEEICRYKDINNIASLLNIVFKNEVEYYSSKGY